MNNVTPIPTTQISLFEQLPGCWGCKDIDSKFVYVNKNYADLLGIDSQDTLIGKTVSELSPDLAKYADNFSHQDKRVIKTKRKIRILNVHPYSNGSWQAHIVTKVPWYNESGDILGVIFNWESVDESALLDIGAWICKLAGTNTHTEARPPSTPSKGLLSKRESEVLFLHLYGKKPQFIAQLLGVSVKTIENHFANLRIKLGANSKTELVDKALELGIGSRIPQTLLKQQFSLIIEE
ncbi:helix-turn-helix transcriptional regulator [Enterovibrio nigricans]|uniref:PAS domain S-box-containing protein n=1 Tax=Enterovibrio nigricans DSM 22720 TaxID=1121868 RepID=A0A1T4VYJ1_9GAMM|nr:helix-turn-helix transcriptional regulator [Enterovibrio nigricans]PKF49044.1 helix-turn-helix transcriptional regulator [Enterovibrio nigricans]SKA69561.1 PAS domain S-box-containing protein [Enterovibrio nigricans DSM 22720]